MNTDQVTAKIDYALISNTQELSTVILNVGRFTQLCSYMRLSVIDKVMTGSGFEEILTEPGLCAGGSIYIRLCQESITIEQ